MNSRQRKTLASILGEPAPANVKWNDAVSVLKALGAEVIPMGGSMTAIKLKGRRAIFHRPHPGNEMPRGLARAIRRFLVNAGVESD